MADERVAGTHHVARVDAEVLVVRNQVLALDAASHVGRAQVYAARGRLPEAVAYDSLVQAPVFLLLSFAVDIVAMVIAMPRALFPEVSDDRFGGGAAVGWLFAAISIGSP